MSYCTVEADKVLIEQNTFGKCLFILKFGEVSVIVNNRKFGILKSPVCFGERALLSDMLRRACIRSN